MSSFLSNQIHEVPRKTILILEEQFNNYDMLDKRSHHRMRFFAC
jgi:hypothetical protein